MEIQHKRQIFLVTNSLLCTPKLPAGPGLWAIALLEPASSGTGLKARNKSGFRSQLPLSELVLLGAQQPRADSGNAYGAECSSLPKI